MVNERGREGARAGAWRVMKILFYVLRVARRGFLCLYDALDDQVHGVMFALTLRRLQRYSFLYLSSKFLPSRLNPFRPALFAISVSYAI